MWIVDPNQDKVFKFVGGALLRVGKINATSKFAFNSGNLNSTDIVTYGAHLRVVNDDGQVTVLDAVALANHIDLGQLSL